MDFDIDAFVVNAKDKSHTHTHSLTDSIIHSSAICENYAINVFGMSLNFKSMKLHEIIASCIYKYVDTNITRPKMPSILIQNQLPKCGQTA